MSDTPTIVGINRTQDASICVMKGPSIVYSLQKERLTRQKHHWGKLGDLKDLYVGRIPYIDEPVDLVVECYSSDSEILNLQDYHRELEEVLTFRSRPWIVRVSHHLAHLYSAFYPSPFSQAAVMVIDCEGSPKKDFIELWEGSAGIASDCVEVASFYHCERGRVECISKQLWDEDWTHPVGLGCFYFLLTRMIFPGEGNEGKVMGLAPYGQPGALGLPPLIVQNERVFIPDEWLKIFKESGRFSFFHDGSDSFENCANLAAAGQQVFEDALLQVAEWLYKQTSATSLCFAGGTALNCSANGRLLRESPFEEIFIPPSPHDGGTALGSALYGMIGCLGADSGFRWVNDFLGPDSDFEATERLLGTVANDFIIEKPTNLIDRIVDLIESGRVVGLYQGRSESGPRALGNRSIIADPRHPGMQSFINQHVKGREWFRPLAPAVLLEAANKLFDIDRPAPFMQFAVDVRAEYQAGLPAVTHVDGTARLQTVEELNTPFLYALLKAFEVKTGCPVLLNTSLNGKGQPLVETSQEAVDCFKTTSMHALVMGPYLIRKRIEPSLPTRP